MNVISVSAGKFKNLVPLDLTDINTEGVIYKFPYAGKKKLLKHLYMNGGIILARKLYNIELLDSNSSVLPNNFVIPESFVSVSHKIVGLMLPYINGVSLKNYLSSDDFSVDDKIMYLKKVGDILDRMVKIRNYTELKHFYLNDMHESNFMVNFDSNDLSVVDLDSCKVNPSFSFPARYLSKTGLHNYISKYVVDDYKNGSYILPNRETDLYCYVIMVLNYLYGDNINNISLTDFYSYLNYLKYIGVDEDLVNCFYRIVSYGDNINPSSFLDSLNSEQICRAKKNVYEMVKSNRLF